MVVRFNSYDGLSFENQKNCLIHEIFLRGMEVSTAFDAYVSYRGGEHPKICKRYYEIKKISLKDFQINNENASLSERRKELWKERKRLKNEMQASVWHLSVLKREWKKKKELLEKAKKQLLEIKEKINKNKEK